MVSGAALNTGKASAAIDMAADDMPAESVSQLESAFKVDTASTS